MDQSAQQGVTGHLTRDEKKYDGSVALSTPLGKASREAIQKSIAGIIAQRSEGQVECASDRFP